MSYAISLPFLAILLLFVYRAPALGGSGVTDPDYYWHVSYGEWIMDHGQLPTSDFWSWTFDGEGYRLTQWLGEVAMGLANQLGGTTGTSTLAALLVSLTMAASYRAARCYLDNRLAALAVAIGSNALLASLACRPHQFTHLGLALLTWIVASFLTTGSRRTLYAVPGLMALWVNLHGGYAVGLAYLFMMAGLTAIESYVGRRNDELKTIALPLALSALGGLLATVLNPYGSGAWQYAIEIARLKSSSAGIVDEWAATSIKADAGLQFFMVSSAMFVAMAMAQVRPRVAYVLGALALCAIGWSAVRVSLMATILMVPFIASALRSTPLYTLAFEGEARRYDRSIKLPIAFAIVAITLAGSITIANMDKTTARYLSEHMPVEEVQFMRAHNINGRLLNTPETGGYLIRELGQKVSIDTRLDLYGDRSLFEYLFAWRGASLWREYIERMNPDVVLINNPAALRELLVSAGLYRLVFEGSTYSILVKPDAYAELPTVEMRPSHELLLSQLKP